MPYPIALTIAGSDSGGGAGIQADLKAFSALQVYGASVITAITAQNTRAVTAVQPLSPDMVVAQMDAVFDDLDVGAIKIGMLGGSDVITAVAARLKGTSIPIVLDPVMVAKSGDALLPDDAVDALRDHLLPLATILTPNLPEAARLLGTHPAETPRQMTGQAVALRALGPTHVLMKGGHAAGDICVDLLVGPQPLTLTAPRHGTKNTHGTGCSLSAAIAAGLAAGLPVPQAISRAHGWLQGAITAADRLGVGHGHGPVHHFHEVWE
ncbi:bifunctional hydroxymethylpyrimidine kinase/phosphomethylpyrimidine kinase [Paracoccus shanxieyensis]|uniref:hydroxymethylpyrimidine kinase n=1 Tax=Paracoccus shanxieyensis TaxID=2675752 RepID=A0A6L6J6L5_9RHOB|nr:bifunctional hydroxymethylpyrimidine kinase/phosphomethylpyrimidine kinase [Paracoccus shanxieyensis]MTH66437.1 bifunctional hydroxymethylpyrimidine kinase/phosphomethylpyrimidine kinase [Paracoccus shanxieyensis]MTH89668.1 bifunctional hydroxymethylpyrimidine kinase/phosphomethylpyrimidine kinase [Paracoccus shanxieyensis]